MSGRRVSASIRSPSVNILIDLGNPLLNRAVDGFIKIGSVGAAQAAAQSIFINLKKESVSKQDLENMMKKVGKEGLQWGATAGIYTGVNYGMARIRRRSDWKNALVGGIITGALLTCTSGNKGFNSDKVVEGAITGGAIATASVFLRKLTY